MAVTRVIKVEADTSGAEANVDQLNDSLNDTDKAAQSASESSQDLGDSLDAATGGAVSGFRKLTQGIGTAVKAMTTLKGAIIATGVGALLVAITSLVAYFTRTERGAQKLREITAGLGAAMDVVADIAVTIGEKLFDAFSNPKQAVTDLWEAIKTNLINRVNGFIELFGNLGSAIEAAFDFDWDTFNDELGKAGRNLIQATTGLDETQQDALVDGIKGVVQEVQNETRAAIELEQALNRVKVQERQLRVLRAEANAEIERQKMIADDVTKSIEERAAAARAAFELEQSIVQQQVANERERLRILEAQAALGESTEETLEAIADQRVRVAELEQQSATKSIELNNKLNALEAERAAKAEEAAAKEAEALQARQDAIAQIEAAQRSAEEAEIFAAEQKYQELISLAQQYGQDTAQLEEQRLAAIEDIRQKYAEQEEQRLLQQAQFDENLRREQEGATISTAQNVLSAVSAFAAEGSETAKALAIASATIDTIQSGIAAYRSTVGIPYVGPILAPIAAAAAVAAGIAQIQRIQSVEIPGATGSAGGAGAAAAGAASSYTNIQAPSVNIGGANNPQLNQIQQSIDNQNRQPLRTYVTTEDVDTASALDRRINDRATFG